MLLHNLLDFCSLINLEFLLFQTKQLNETIILSFLVFTALGFLLSFIFYTLNNKVTLFYKYIKS